MSISTWFVNRFFSATVAVCLVFTAFAGLMSCTSLGDTTESNSTLTANEIYVGAIPDWEALQIALPKATSASAKLMAEDGDADAETGETEEEIEIADIAPDDPDIETPDSRLATFYYMALSNAEDWAKLAKIIFNPAVAVAGLPPTSVTGSKHIWELKNPVVKDSVIVPRLSILNNGPESYDIQFEIVPMSTENASGDYYRVFWMGDMSCDPEIAGRGTGTFAVNFTAAHAIEPQYTATGVLNLFFNNTSNSVQTLQADYRQFTATQEAGSEPFSWVTNYELDEEGTGYYAFVEKLNWSRLSDKPEIFSVVIKWQADGIGQALVTITGEDLTAQGLDNVELHECWSAQAIQSYYTQINNWSEKEATESSEVKGSISNCVFDFEDLATKFSGEEDSDGDTDGDVDAI